MSDFKELTLGMILGYITTYNNSRNEEDEENIRDANQSDFDKF